MMSRSRFFRACRPLAALVLCWAVPGAAGQADSPARDAAFLARYFASLKTISAGFEQVVFGESGARLQDASGRMWIRRPGRFRWDYEQPYRQLVLGDGRRVWSYDPELEQAIVKPVDEVLASSPAMILSGDTNPETVYHISHDGVSGDVTWFRLTPKAADDGFGVARIGFVDAELRELEFSDPLGQMTRIRFHDVQHNVEMDAALFSFTPPPGVDVLGER